MQRLGSDLIFSELSMNSGAHLSHFPMPGGELGPAGMVTHWCYRLVSAMCSCHPKAGPLQPWRSVHC